MQQHLAADEGLDAARFLQRHCLGVAQVAVGLVFHNTTLAVDGEREQPAQRIGFNLARLVNATDDRGAILGDPAFFLQRLDLFWRIGAGGIDPPRP